MKRRNEYVMFPGHCMVTRSSDTSHGVLDLEYDRDYDGASYLSGQLVEEAAALWGWVPPEKYEEIVFQRDALQQKLSEMSLAVDAVDALEEAATQAADLIDRAKRIQAAV